MKLHVGSLILVLFFGLTTNASIKPTMVEMQQSQFKLCKSNSLKLSDPNSRDQARLNCITKEFPTRLGIESCVKEAKKFEYLLNEQSALRSCYYSKPQFAGMKNCLFIAKELHSLGDRDDMRLECVSSIGLPRGRNSCLEVANKFEQGQLKKKLITTCLEN
ncbi:MAG: hypothetical protein ACK5V3_01995 [Bdellovibrionales bacterium]